MSSTNESGSWLKKHPDEQTFMEFHVDDQVIHTPLFMDLGPEEEQSFRQHARENYVVGSPINDINHPVWRDEARKMNAEAEEEKCNGR